MTVNSRHARSCVHLRRSFAHAPRPPRRRRGAGLVISPFWNNPHDCINKQAELLQHHSTANSLNFQTVRKLIILVTKLLSCPPTRTKWFSICVPGSVGLISPHRHELSAVLTSKNVNWRMNWSGLGNTHFHLLYLNYLRPHWRCWVHFNWLLDFLFFYFLVLFFKGFRWCQ